MLDSDSEVKFNPSAQLLCYCLVFCLQLFGVVVLTAVSQCSKEVQGLLKFTMNPTALTLLK